MKHQAKKELIRKPTHYRGDDGKDIYYIIDNWKLDFFRGNALKYIMRAGKKGGESTIKDLDKAIYTLEYFKKLLENKER